MEVGAAAQRVVDARVAERLVALETADIDVPAPPDQATLAPLYFRVVLAAPSSLKVELWELGKPEGARSVSATGSASLEARRIALAAAELARRFREHRVAELAAVSAAREAASAQAVAGQGIPIYARLAWSAGAAALGVSSGFLVGPRLEGALRFRSGPRVALGAAWLFGTAKRDGASRSARLLEFPLAVSDAVPLSPATALDVGLGASLGSVRLGGDGSEPSLDTWTARGFAFTRFEANLGRTFALAIGPDVSVLLRRVPGSFGGLAVGGTLTLTATP